MQDYRKKQIGIISLLLGLMFLIPIFRLLRVRIIKQTTIAVFVQKESEEVSLLFVISSLSIALALTLLPYELKKWRTAGLLLHLGCFAGSLIAHNAFFFPILFISILWLVSLRASTSNPLLLVLTLLIYAIWPLFIPNDAFGPSFGIRPLVSRTRLDMRNMADAIESYHTDHGAYPSSSLTGPFSFWKSDEQMASFSQVNGVGSLTTPIAYIKAYMEDPCRILKDSRTFGYFSKNGHWILISPGPDCKFDITNEFLDSLFSTFDTVAIDPAFLERVYDPSNGSISSGDIFRMNE